MATLWDVFGKIPKLVWLLYCKVSFGVSSFPFFKTREGKMLKGKKEKEEREK